LNIKIEFSYNKLDVPYEYLKHIILFSLSFYLNNSKKDIIKKNLMVKSSTITTFKKKGNV